jgi:Sugar-tranasporters, 12 TM
MADAMPAVMVDPISERGDNPSSQILEGSFGVGLFVLGFVLLAMIVKARQDQKQKEGASPVILTADFKEFQGTFLRVYLIALLTEWLQGAFIFMLMHAYAHGPGQIASIFLVGVSTQLVAAVLLEAFGSVLPNKAWCVACLGLQAASCALLMHPAFGGMVVSRGETLPQCFTTSHTLLVRLVHATLCTAI